MTRRKTLTEYYRELNDFYGEEVYELDYNSKSIDDAYDEIFNSYYNPSENLKPYSSILDKIDEELYDAGKLDFIKKHNKG